MATAGCLSEMLRKSVAEATAAFRGKKLMIETEQTSEVERDSETGVTGTLRAAAREARAWTRQHPRIGLGVLASLMLAGAGGAFAVVTPNQQDDVVIRQVLEVVQPATALSKQEADLRAHDFVLYRNTETRENDTAASLLTRLGVSDAAAESYLRATDAVRGEVLGQNLRQVQAEVLPDQRLQSLRVRWVEPGQTRRYQELTVSREGDGFRFQNKSGATEVRAELASIPLTGKYFQATGAAGVPSAVATQVLDIFDPVANIEQDARKGDNLTVAYESVAVDGQVLGFGRVLNARVLVQGSTHSAVLFDGGRGQSGKYYTPEGKSLDLAYLPSPIPSGAIITSGFSPYRIHPVFGEGRPHTGVDYRAAIGTPVVTVADGTVSFAGVQTGYGNVVIVEHANKQSTLYAHLNQIHVRVGQKVAQGSLIAKSGNTGWSTGPHLHFETRNNDVPENPEVVLAEKRAETLTASQRPAFNQAVALAQRNWEQAQAIQLASAR